MDELSKDTVLAEFHRFLYFGDDSKMYPNCVSYPFNSEKIQNLFQNSELGTDAIQEIVHAYRDEHYLSIDTIIYALAVYSHASNLAIKQAAFKAANDLCLSSSSLLTFVNFYKELSKPTKGWSRGHRKFLCDWYNKKEPMNLAVEVTKVKTYKKWTHKDVICMAHVKTDNPGIAAVIKFIIKGYEAAEREYASEAGAEAVLKYLKGIHDLRHSNDPESAARKIETYDLCLEHIPSKLLKTKEVSLCLIPRLPIKKLLSLMPLFCKVGFLKLNSPHYKAVLERLNSEDTLNDASIGPLETFFAMRKLQIANRIFPGKSIVRYNIPAIDNALQNLHLASFKSVVCTQKRYLIAVDIRQSMSQSACAGCRIVTPCNVSNIILLALVKAEISNVAVVVFSPEELVSVEINHKMTISDVNEHMSQVTAGPVNASAPLQWALTKKKAYDLFLLFTDTFANMDSNGFSDIFKEYKDTLHLSNARYLICSLCDHKPTLLDVPNALNIAGFHLKLLKVIQDFANGVF